MLTKEQKVKKLNILHASYSIQSLVSKTLNENIKSSYANFGETKREVRENLIRYTNVLEEELALPSSSLFDATELSNLETVVSSSILYGS